MFYYLLTMRSPMDIKTIFWIALIGSSLFFAVIILYVNRETNKRSVEVSATRKRVFDFVYQQLEISADEFIDLKTYSLGGRGNPQLSRDYNVPAAYVIRNTTKEKYFIGSGQRVLDLIYRHFTNSGNFYVYGDYGTGDEFTVKIIQLGDTNFTEMKELRRDLIEKHDANKTGYNVR